MRSFHEVLSHSGISATAKVVSQSFVVLYDESPWLRAKIGFHSGAFLLGKHQQSKNRQSMSERRWTQLRWVVCIAGFFLSLLLLVPEFEDEKEVSSTPPSELAITNPQFPIPTPRPRKEGLGLSRSFLFELAGSDKMAGLEREQNLMQRYDDIVDRLDGNRVPQVGVKAGPYTATVTIDDKPFVTVLPQDCPEYFSRLDDEGKLQLETEVAYAWARLIHEHLVLENFKRDPEFLELYNYLALVTFFLVSIAQLSINWFSRRFVHRPLWSLKLLLWVVYFTTLTRLHPTFDTVGHYLSRGALHPIIDFIAIGATMLVLHQLTRLVLHRYLEALAQFDNDHQETERAALRRKTLAQAWTFVSQIGWSFLGLYLYFSQLGVDLAQFFAGAGLIGVAIGVMARDVFLDLFNGAYILAEDQFVVGDWIESNSDTGEVIEFSLRSTKIRRTDGSIAIIPNAELRQVRNHSYRFSTVDFRVSVCHSTDTDYAMELILEEVGYLDVEWPGKIKSLPQALGVQELGLKGIVLRVRFSTLPLAQLEASRRLNRRVKVRFDKERILLAGDRLVSVVRVLDHEQPWPSVPSCEADSLPTAEQAKESSDS